MKLTMAMAMATSMDESETKYIELVNEEKESAGIEETGTERNESEQNQICMKKNERSLKLIKKSRN